METMVKAQEASYAYPVYDENGNISGQLSAVNRINMEIVKGEFVAVLGRNGSGKSTFAQMINALLIPQDGYVCTDGLDTRDEEKIWDIRHRAGMVFQNPDNQIIASIVEEDVAFGPENLGYDPERIRFNVDRGLQCVGMKEYAASSTNKLSGGQKQRVAVAGILAMEPDCIILDEPTAMLDPKGRQEVLSTVEMLNREHGITVIYITHHMDEAARADRIVVVADGHEVLNGTPRQVFSQVSRMKELGLDVPQATELAHRLRQKGLDLPGDVMTMEELAEALKKIPRKNGGTGKSKPEDAADKEPVSSVDRQSGGAKETAASEPLLEIRDLCYVYDGGTSFAKKALDNVSFSIGTSEFIGVIGHTGSGKSTLMQHLNALLHPSSGEVLYRGQNLFDPQAKELRHRIRQKVGLVFQYPEHQLFETTVWKDVAFGPANMKLEEEEIRRRVQWALSLVGMDESFYTKSPFDLSGGQKRRVALAGVLAMKPEILILDEPAAGLDPVGRDSLFEQIVRLKRDTHMSVLLVSHSMEDVARYVDRVLVLEQGRLALDGPGSEVFSHREQLESMGLSVPQICDLAGRLRRDGWDIPQSTIRMEQMEEVLTEVISC